MFDDTGYEAKKGKKPFLKLEVGGKVRLRVLSYTEGIGPEDMIRKWGSMEHAEKHMTEPNDYGKHPHSFIVVVLDQTEMMELNPLNHELIWNGRNSACWEIMDYMFRGCIPEHPKYGKNTVVVERRSKREYVPKWYGENSIEKPAEDIAGRLPDDKYNL